MTSELHNSHGDSSTGVSMSKETEEGSHDLERDVPGPEKEARSEKDNQSSVVTDWDGPNDPENPQTWPASKKTYHILVPTVLGFVVSVRSFRLQSRPC
jgi:hypothetical protein